MLNWIEIKEGCAMPEIDEFVIWRREDGNYMICEIDKDDPDWWNGEDGTWYKGPKCTHWARIEEPSTEPNQEELLEIWNEVATQLNDRNLDAPGRRQGVIEWLQERYTLSRK